MTNKFIICFFILVILGLIVYSGEKYVNFEPQSKLTEEQTLILKNLQKETQSDVVKPKEIENLDDLIKEYLGLKKQVQYISSESREKIESVDSLDDLQKEPVDEADYDTYNHKLRLRNISKQIKNDYIIGLLKSKIDFLLGTMENVDNLCKIEK